MVNRLILAFAFPMAFISCDGDWIDLPVDPVGPGGDPVSAGYVEGNWEVKRFVDEGEDETDSFDDIVLTFEPDGVFRMHQGADEIATGVWNLENNGTELNIQVPVFVGENESLGEDLYEIHDDWMLMQGSSGEMHLKEEDEHFELVRQ